VAPRYVGKERDDGPALDVTVLVLMFGMPNMIGGAIMQTGSNADVI
jgi:hypothetical protein